MRNKNVNLVIRTQKWMGSSAASVKLKALDDNPYPNSYHLFENKITLPLNTRMTQEDVEYVIKNFVDIVKNL